LRIKNDFVTTQPHRGIDQNILDLELLDTLIPDLELRDAPDLDRSPRLRCFLFPLDLPGTARRFPFVFSSGQKPWNPGGFRRDFRRPLRVCDRDGVLDAACVEDIPEALIPLYMLDFV